MACEQVGDFLVCPRPNDDGGTVWWDAGGGTIWDIDVGGFSDWATVIVALIAIRAAWKASSRSNALQAELVRVETAREDRFERALGEREEAQRRAVQADHVAAWFGGHGERIKMLSGRGYPSVGYRVGVRNGSGLPVYEVEVLAVGPEQGRVRGRTWIGTVGPEEQEFYEFPKFTAETRVATTASGKPEEYEEDARTLDVAVRFRDTAGNRWFRDEDGNLNPDPRYAKSKSTSAP